MKTKHKFPKKTICIYCGLIILLAVLCNYLFFSHSSSAGLTDISPGQSGLLVEQVKSIQRQAGCIKIDGVIGRETTRLVNAAVEAEQKENFNDRAAKYFDPNFYGKTK